MAVAGFSSLEFEVKAVFMLKISGPCEVGNVTNQNFMVWLKQLFSNFVSFQSVFNVWSLRSMRTQTNKKNPLALKWSFLNSIMTHWCYPFYTNPDLRVNVQNLFILADTPAQMSLCCTCVFPNVCGNLQASSLSRLNSSLHLWECVGSRQTWMMNMMISDMCEYVSLTFQSPSFTRISWLIVRKYSLFTVTKNNVRPPEN